MSKSRHPAIIGLGNTFASDATSQLIMVVGREPNSHAQVTQGLGRYTFSKDREQDEDYAPHCGLWNSTYTVMARAIGLNGGTAGEAKEMCRVMRRSPVIFSDAMPKCLPNALSEQAKNAFRNAIPEHEVRAHIKEVFSHKAIISRVRLVLLSGHNESSGLMRASELYEEACRILCIPVHRVPFMFGNNVPAIMESMTSEHTAIIRQVWSNAIGSGPNASP
jgi:hypothetical protein